MSEEQRRPHPLETMDDITEVSSAEEIEKVNTVMVTKNTEARNKTVIAVLGGGVFGLIPFFIVGPLFSWTLGALLLVVCALISPLLFVGTVRDATQQVRWRRMLNQMRSRNIAGEVFYPNSDGPENITELKEMWIR